MPEAVLDVVMRSISPALKFSTKVTQEEGEKRAGKRGLKIH